MIGCVADDLTGATDIAANFVARGYRTDLHIGVPLDAPGGSTDAADAVVVALKSRNAPVDSAITDSRASLAWLRAAGCARFIFKYCSTFDSTDRGNIGPVAEALLADLGAEQTVFVPTYPATGRTLYQGHLFVGDVPLADSGMRHHPLTPMRDSNIVRVLGRQSRPRVDLVALPIVREGAVAIRARLGELRAAGVAFVVVDAVTTADLDAVAQATSDYPLLTGGAGIVSSLPRCDGGNGSRLAATSGPRAVLVGSRSDATRAQVAHARDRMPGVVIDPDALRQDFAAATAETLRHARSLLGAHPVMVFVADEVDGSPGDSALLVERAFGEIAVGLRDAGVNRFIVAGGETSGAVVSALGVRRLGVGRLIEPGLAWTSGRSREQLVNLLLKSGNFGSTELFESAWRAA